MESKTIPYPVKTRCCGTLELQDRDKIIYRVFVNKSCVEHLRRCSKCEQELPETEFYPDRKYLRSQCKNCCSKDNDNYYQKNKETIKNNVAVYKKKHRKTYSEWNKKWRKTKDGFRYCFHYRREHYKNNKEQYREQRRKYLQNNRDKCNQHTRKRRLKKRQLFEDFTIEQWNVKVEKTNGICPLCNRPFSDIRPFCATIDHTPPISKAPAGFHYSIQDIQPLCGSCNSSKGGF
jgi:hypothetical protein